MTGNGLNAITPDALTGMIFAMEGIQNTIVLLNGPMGCRFYHSTTSQFLSIHPLLYLPSENGNRVPVDYNYLNNWFFRQQRVPCTYLDGYDYVYGTVEKVCEGIRYIRDHIAFDLLVIINAPGASLIGDMLEDAAAELLPEKNCVVLESPGFSTGYEDGCSQAMLQLLKKRHQEGAAHSGRKEGKQEPQKEGRQEPQKEGRQEPQKEGRQGTHREGKQETEKRPAVNVFGLSIWNRYFEGDREETERILRLCGIRVNTFLCADCSLEEIDHIPEADLNLVIDPLTGLASAQYLEETLGMPYYCCSALPVGFDAVEKLCRELSGALGTDPAGLLEESRRARAYAWYKINGIYQSCGLPKGARFAVEGSSSQIRGYSDFLRSYLGMEASSPEECELYFADANQIAKRIAEHQIFCGIEISLPGMGYTDLVKKTHLGIQGSLFLIEQVLNGLMSRL